ncbi:hypothetical protein M758_12G090800 [Ceratodon purpureus]|nr:hypothetical protein M758_12G090800 [Ceratodon purpureus]
MSMVEISSKFSSSSTSSLVEVDVWNLCKQHVRSIRDLANGGTLLNKRQCLDLSYKLSNTTQNIKELLSHCGAPAVLFRPALENLYRYLEKAKVLVKQCREKDWCQASVYQSQNQNAFREILLDVSFCYNAIFEQVKSASEDWLGHPEDLRQSPMFMPATASDVYEDQQDLQKRLEELAKKPSCILRKRSKRSGGVKLLDHVRSEKAALTQCLARYTLVKLKCTSEQSQVNALDTCSTIFWVKETEPSGTWGNYKLLGSGSGASGVCSTTWLGVPCAKKEFHAQASERFFLEEAGILAYLKHPCIVNFFCCGNGKEKGDRFIAMELMEKSLLDLIEGQRDMHFSLPVVVDIILQIARGMCYLHEQGVAHCDLKPGNVVVNKLTYSNHPDYFCVKLVDFGMSKTKVQVSKSNTISVRGVGTTRYRAPEVHPKAHPDGKGKANWFRADVYSFAITCAHVLSMKVPFGDMLMPMSELYTELINGRRPELSNNCPMELVILIRDCWNTNPYSRPSFVEVCTRLEKFRYKHIIEFRHLRGFSTHEQRMQERRIDCSTGFDFIEKKMKEQISVSRSFADDRKDEEGGTNDTHGNNGNDSVSIVPSSRKHTHVRRSSSLTKFFYDFRVTLYILLEPLLNSMAFWTNQGRLLFSSLTKWVPISARDNDLGEPSERSKSRVESKDLKPKRFLGQGCSGIFYEVTWSGLQSMDLLVRKDIPGVSGHVFEHEAARLVELEHPNIVKNYCWTVDKRSCTLVMEYVKDDLYSVVKKRGEVLWKAGPPRDPVLSNHFVNVANFPFKMLDAIPIMLELATGIEYLHSRGIPHGDLKPSNVLVDLESDPIVVKVADYGLIESKRMATLMSKQAFCFRMIEWSAPEVFEDYFRSMSEDLDYMWTTSPTGSDVSVASESYFGNCPVALQLEKGDSYSFGLICAFIISGRLWNANLSPGELRKRILSESLRPELPLECPKTLASLISSCWDVNPTCRPIFSDIRRKLHEIFLEQQEEEAQKEKDVQQAEDLAQLKVDLAHPEEDAQNEEVQQAQLVEDSRLVEVSEEFKWKSIVRGGAENSGPGSFSLVVSEHVNKSLPFGLDLPCTSEEYARKESEVTPVSTNSAKLKSAIPEKSPSSLFRRSSLSEHFQEIEVLHGENTFEAADSMDIGYIKDMRSSRNLHHRSQVKRRQNAQVQSDGSGVKSNTKQFTCWPYFDPDFESSSNFNPPKVTIENDTNASATVVKVDSDNRHGILLNVIQLFTDLELTIKKCDIFSDSGWFYDVFHVVDRNGRKVRGLETLDYIYKVCQYHAMATWSV